MLPACSDLTLAVPVLNRPGTWPDVDRRATAADRVTTLSKRSPASLVELQD